MRDYFLKFTTEELFDTTMETIGWRNEFTFQETTSVSYGSQYIILDRIGPVTITPGVYDENLNEITAPVIDDAYHVNLRIMDETEFPEELEPFRITVNSPRRIFAGGMNVVV
jgi:hypothetical protein